MGSDGFAARYRAAVAQRGRLCAGVDPHPELLERWGLPVSADGVARFGDLCVEGLGPVAAVIKPQVAFFEPFGAAGFAALERVITGCREAGALVLADAKRGDIGSTMAAYARAWLTDDSPLGSDAVTASPFLGFGSLTPAVTAARESSRAVIVLARTSNPEGGTVQLAVGDRGSVGQSIVDEAAAVNADGRGTVGVVVGATRAHGLDLRGLGGVVLAPGMGAQGATAADLAEVFAEADQDWLLPASSRDILGAGPDPAALATACGRTRDDVESALAPL
ncbi:orotidine-5'-phosphate decarboxylase [Gordonia sp. (in: high G+C Gram-positive bacteria)]|uniref:orotidine-5'-phosphate decarboxylase n=1 Tax=Gordonia sp. (in: high G+C Gram-positive bacteria) TaxID=84139 RepID=UPI0039E5D08F